MRTEAFWIYRTWLGSGRLAVSPRPRGGDWLTATGSYNLTLRSARADLELEFYVQSEEFGGAVRDAIAGDIALSTPIAPTALDRFRSRRSLPIIDALVRYCFL